MKSSQSDSVYDPELAFAELDENRQRAISPNKLRLRQIWDELVENNRLKKESAATSSPYPEESIADQVRVNNLPGPAYSNYGGPSSRNNYHGPNQSSHSHSTIPEQQTQQIRRGSANLQERTVNAYDSNGRILTLTAAGQLNPSAQEYSPSNNTNSRMGVRPLLVRNTNFHNGVHASSNSDPRMYGYAVGPSAYQQPRPNVTSVQSGIVVPSYYIAIPPPSYFIPQANSTPVWTQNTTSNSAGVPVCPQAPVYVASPFSNFGHGVAVNPNGQAYYYYPYQPRRTGVATVISNQNSCSSQPLSLPISVSDGSSMAHHGENLNELRVERQSDCKLNPYAPEFKPGSVVTSSGFGVNKNSHALHPQHGIGDVPQANHQEHGRRVFVSRNFKQSQWRHSNREDSRR